ncbi:hypothetical protein [Streptomyces sp. NPDC001594]|uniref:hypothetical protein n=1 Tax=Streptomyces sp. NPDC001594 TaxID=3364590 RepID=UPI003697C406
MLILVEEGTIALDDPSPGPPGTVGLNDRIAEADRVDAVTLPVRDGITIARRR